MMKISVLESPPASIVLTAVTRVSPSQMEARGPRLLASWRDLRVPAVSVLLLGGVTPGIPQSEAWGPANQN